MKFNMRKGIKSIQPFKLKSKNSPKVLDVSFSENWNAPYIYKPPSMPDSMTVYYFSFQIKIPSTAKNIKYIKHKQITLWIFGNAYEKAYKPNPPTM